MIADVHIPTVVIMNTCMILNAAVNPATIWVDATIAINAFSIIDMSDIISCSTLAGMDTLINSFIILLLYLNCFLDRSTYVSFLMNIQYIIRHVATSADSMVAIAAPSTPHPSVYMNIGSIIIFSIPVNASARVALFTSPSALSSLDSIPLNTIVKDPRVIIDAYGFAYCITDDAPIATSIGSRHGITIIISRIDIIIPVSTPCSALLLAFSLSSEPMYLDISEFAPAPNPFASPPYIINSGVTNPNAARGSDPNPDTHTLSNVIYHV